MKRAILSLFIVLLLSGCFQNVRHKIGITTKPFAKNDGFESSTKLNYSIIFGVVRPKEDDD
jgi:PBP1b-binding outer membrane lipoprotein LpoB